MSFKADYNSVLIRVFDNLTHSLFGNFSRSAVFWGQNFEKILHTFERLKVTWSWSRIEEGSLSKFIFDYVNITTKLIWKSNLLSSVLPKNQLFPNFLKDVCSSENCMINVCPNFSDRETRRIMPNSNPFGILYSSLCEIGANSRSDAS